jgi:hypothetical protein
VNSGDARGVAPIEALALDQHGRIVVGQTFGVTRLNADGSWDSSFLAPALAAAYAIAVQHDGRIVVGGRFQTVAGTPRSNLAQRSC